MSDLTRAMIDGLIRIRDKGPSEWCDGGRAGGATSRMFERMAKAGLCTKPPHTITLAGKAALDQAAANADPFCLQCRMRSFCRSHGCRYDTRQDGP